MREGFEALTGVPSGMLIFGGIVVAVVISVFATITVEGLSQWSRDNASPVVATAARVVMKRSDVHGGGESRALAAYSATFETSSGYRRELLVPADELGLIADGDTWAAHLPEHPLQSLARSVIRSVRS
jgi:hypothetical protein